jgi:hypothetical protein
MDRRGSFRLNEEMLARPVLMSVAMGVAVGPVVALITWFGISPNLILGSYLFKVVTFVVVIALAVMFSTSSQQNAFPAGLSPQDRAELRRIVWFELPVTRPDYATALLAYCKRALRGRVDILMAVAGVLVVVAGATAPLVYKTDSVSELVRFMITTGLVGIAAFALIPYLRGVRRRLERLRKGAEELLGV